MFLHLSVSHSVHKGGRSLSGIERPSQKETIPPCMVKSGQYISYWNAFLFSLIFVAAAVTVV